ncbi:MAG: hypothetical protein ACTSWQ_03175 [Candidatus Thorarchaeota archaeon]
MAKKNPIQFELPAEKMKHLVHLMRSYSVNMETTSWDFHQKGLLIYSGDSDAVSLLVISAGPEFFKDYEVQEPVELQIDADVLDDIGTLLSAAGNTMISIYMTSKLTWFTFKYDNITRKIKIPPWDEEEGRTHQNYDAALNVYPNGKNIGSLKIEELKMFLKASATWKGESDRITMITKRKSDGKLQMITELKPDLDEVVFDLTEMKKKYKEDTLEILLQSSRLNSAIKNIAPFTKDIILRGGTNFPLMLMSTDQNPNTAEDFKEDFNFWYLIAPRIESE